MVLAAALLSACGGGGSGGGPASPQARLDCTAITTASLGLPGMVVASAARLPASGAAGSATGYPEHCQVLGSMNERTGLDGRPYAIGFDIRLPASNWNGKFFYSGDAAIDGVIFDPLGTTAVGGTTNALSLGYAVASSDGGHIDRAGGFDGSFGQDPQARIDYGYNALGTLTPRAKQVIAAHYGSAPSRTYYTGCSKGGQSGLIAASRFADQFDGIIAGNPGMDLPKASIAQLWDTQQYASVDPGIQNAFAPRDLQLVSSKILARCDALDGAADGMVTDTAACQAAFNFSRDVPACASGASADGTCLTPVQKTALQAIFDGPRSSSGVSLYSSWPWDPGIVGSNWTFWKTFLNPVLGPIAMGNIWATPPAPTIAPFSPAATAYWQGYNIDTAYNDIFGTTASFRQSSMDFMAMPDPLLTGLKTKGKLLVYHGTADAVFSSQHTTAWYDKLRLHDPSSASYARLFLVPGMSHCIGGPATDRFDALSALADWVEKGTAPDQIVATIAPDNVDKPASWSASRSRPLCPYPKKALLKAGATDLEAAASFECR